MPPEQIQPAEYNYQQPQRQLPVKTLVVVAVLALLALLVVNWLASAGSIMVTTEGAEGGVSYAFTNQANEKTDEVEDAPATYKKSVTKGVWELMVKNTNKSFFSVVKSGGFLKTTNVTARLESEKARRFVGNDPASCVHLLKNTLVSYECNDAISTLKTHVPATASLPTYNKASPYQSDDVIEGIIDTKNGDDLLILYEVEVAGHGEHEDENTSHHIAFRMPDSGVRPGTGTPLQGLEEKIYAFQPYLDGFIAYDTGISRIFHFQKLGQKPTELKPEGPAEGFAPYTINTEQGSLVIGYSEKSEEESSEDASSRKSEIVIMTGSGTKRFAFGKTYQNIKLCGENKLCAQSETALDVFDISGEEAVREFGITGVEDFIVLDGRLIAIKGGDILSIDTASRSGYVEYSYGDYTPCGLYPSNGSYMVCISNDSGAKSLLLIDHTKPSDDIDKKIAQLIGIDEVVTVSAYDKFIFISPKAGELKYRSDIGGFGYDPVVLKAANDAINKKIDELGIDRKAYVVKSTLR